MVKKLSPPKVITGGFAGIILLGTVLLMLPISSAGKEATGFLEALFTATSSVCVTGLIVVDTGTYWSSFGQLVIISLIQIGGLGFMTIATFITILSGQKIGIERRVLIQESLGQDRLSGIVAFAKRVFITAFAIEALGAVLLLFKFAPMYGMQKGLWYSIFHSISAFCNAGFDIFGNYQSLTAFRFSIWVNIIISLLIILGGLGFTVMEDLIENKKHLKRLSLHSKLVLEISAALILIGTIIFFVIEGRNPDTLGEMNFFQRLITAFFQSVSTRTAGFNTIDQAAMTESGRFMTVLLMFIGGSPGSTAGGIKTTTVAVTVLATLAYIRKTDVQAHGRRIGYSIVNKAMAIMMIAFITVLLSALVIGIENPNIQFINILYETVSAFGTVGLSTGITPTLTTLSKLILIFLMFAGRVGTLTIILAIAGREGHEHFRYPEGRVSL